MKLFIGPHYGALGFTKELILRKRIFSHTFLRVPYYLSNFAWTSLSINEAKEKTEWNFSFFQI